MRLRFLAIAAALLLAFEGVAAPMAQATDNGDDQLLASAADSPNLQQRVRQRAIAQAIAVTTEDPATASHAQRLALAGAVFQGSASARFLVELILANPTNRQNAIAIPAPAGEAITDANIDFQLAAVWTGVALSRSW